MKELHLFLKGCWFDKIAAGEKNIEYREVAKWEKKLITRPGVSCHFDKKKCQYVFSKVAFPVILHRGYTNNVILKEIYKIKVVNGLETDLKVDKPVFALYLREF